MDNHDLVPLIIPVITFISVCISLAVSIRNGGKIHEVHVAINSRMDELLRQAGISSRAEGREEGRLEGRINASSLIEAAALVEKQRKEND